jgi:hypothetical protein
MNSRLDHKGAREHLRSPNSADQSDSPGYSIFQTEHSLIHLKLLHGSAAVEDHIEIANVRRIIDDFAFHFHPRMRTKRHLLDADHHLRGNPASPEKAASDRGSLEAQHFLKIEGASQVDRATYAFLIFRGGRVGIDRKCFDAAI